MTTVRDRLTDPTGCASLRQIIDRMDAYAASAEDGSVISNWAYELAEVESVLRAYVPSAPADLTIRAFRHVADECIQADTVLATQAQNSFKAGYAAALEASASTQAGHESK
jgi:hypothetical protein